MLKKLVTSVSVIASLGLGNSTACVRGVDLENLINGSAISLITSMVRSSSLWKAGMQSRSFCDQFVFLLQNTSSSELSVRGQSQYWILSSAIDRAV
jgi:hypothetical protein